MVKSICAVNLNIFANAKPKRMQELEFTLTKEFIELNKLLKILSLVESGGQANSLIADGFVRYNGEFDTRKRLKLRKGDVVEYVLA